MSLTAGMTAAADLKDALGTLRSVGPKGAGNEAAAAAWKEAARADVSQVPQLLAALDGANPLAANWIRTAVDAVCERSLRDHGTLPKDALMRFVFETSHDPKGRRLAYEWLLQAEPAVEDRIVPQLLDDPSVELRRDAVARLIGQGEAATEAGHQKEALNLLQTAFDAARDRDQIDTLVGQLKKLGRDVDLVKHDGLLVDWLVIGPFDNTDEAGFDKVYPPEKTFDPKAKCRGKHGEISWAKYTSGSPKGVIDFYKALETMLAKEQEQEREVLGYAVAEFHSPAEQKVQIRSSSRNAIKIWLNGELVDEHNIYHAGYQFDQFQVDVTLKPGKNRIMVKVCQNAQTQDWTNHFDFQLRICDKIGTGILSANKD
jgi:hypothetical protein